MTPALPLDRFRKDKKLKAKVIALENHLIEKKKRRTNLSSLLPPSR
jgi:hypothetical protein